MQTSADKHSWNWSEQMENFIYLYIHKECTYFSFYIMGPLVKKNDEAL